MRPRQHPALQKKSVVVPRSLENAIQLLHGYLFLIHTAIVDLVNRLDAEEVRRVAGI
jgi:hypothetical protein